VSGRTEELPADRWVEYFDSVSRQLDGQLVTIEVMSDELGDQTDVERLPLQAIGYDPKENLLEISIGGRGPRYPVVLRHFISSPQKISVEESAALSPSAILVSDDGGMQTLIRMFDPAALGAGA
jgi:hypothetical protein